MQTIADLKFLQLAQIVIKLGKRAFLVLVWLYSAITVKPDANSKLKDVT